MPKFDVHIAITVEVEAEYSVDVEKILEDKFYAKFGDKIMTTKHDDVNYEIHTKEV